MYGRSGGYPGGGFGLMPPPEGVKWIMIANVAIWVLAYTFDSSFVPGFWERLMLDSREFRVWQPVTYMWLHGEGAFHVFGNMLMLYFLGSTLERFWGTRRFVRFYLICGVGAGVFIAFMDQVLPLIVSSPPHVTLGASGAVYGVAAAYCVLWPNQTVMLLFPPIPIRVVYLLPALFVMQLLGDTAGPNGESISHAGHIGGVLMAFGYLHRELSGAFEWLSIRRLRNRWRHRQMRSHLRAVRREEMERHRRARDDRKLH